MAKDGGPAFDNEHELSDDYPVYGDYFYVVDDKPVRSPVFGTVRDLKRALGATEIRRCNIAARQSAMLAARED